MPRTGRPPKPTALKRLQGTARPDRVHADEPRPTVGPVTCPLWLDPEAKREWRRVAPELARLGLLTTVDRGALAAYCQSWARFVQAERTIGELGQSSEVRREASDGTVYVARVEPRPEVAISQRERATMRAFLVGFGLDPASRTRLHAAPAEPADPFEDFLAAGR